MSKSGDLMRSRTRTVGKFSFWLQVGIGVASGFSWLFALTGQINRGFPSIGSQLAVWVTLVSLLLLGGNSFLTFRYWKSRETRSLKIVLYLSLAGAFLAVISSAAQVGDLLASLIFRATLVTQQEVWGLLLAATNANITFAHLFSLTGVLWIYGIIGGKSNR